MSERHGCLPELVALCVFLIMAVMLSVLFLVAPESRVVAATISASNGSFGLRWDSSAVIERQRQNTARKLAEEETNRLQAQEGARIARIMWIGLAAFGALAVVAWVWTRVAVARAQPPPPELMLNIAQRYLSGDNVDAEFVDGIWAVVDHDKQEIIP